MVFDYDKIKSKANQMKHGIDFEEARKLWNDPRRIEIPARTTDESRVMTIADIDGIIWAAVFTYRDDVIRLISVRRARRNEKEIYHSTGV